MQNAPAVSGIKNIDTVRVKHSDSLFTIGRNSLYKNKYGIWELYIEGDPLELGLVNGSLTRDLMHRQESAIMEKIETLVPPGGYQNFLWKVVSWFNRKMHLHVPEEYQQEIYGISRFASPEYNRYAPPYVRALYLHGAHDIGHALQDLMLVGCTSFAAWGSKTEDGQLLLGRNFDFYAGDEFAKEKIAAFVNPDQGHKFMMYTWGGMIGTVSGINEKGLTVTINAGKSQIPWVAKTPISLVAREILQYAQNTTEAIAIAKKREVFVSEAIMIGSAEEGIAIIIEVSPRNFGVHEVLNSNQIVCSNHFQSEAYKNDKRNITTMEESHTTYRYERMTELLSSAESIDPEKAATILRNRNGLEDEKIGLGNEKAINQLLAHHGIIFKPAEKKVWISANPYQLGAFVAYDLEEAFQQFASGNEVRSVIVQREVIPKDSFLSSKIYRDYEEFRKLKMKFLEDIEAGRKIKDAEIRYFLGLNPHFWEGYALAGNYYFGQEEYKKAVIHYKQAQQREITTVPDQLFLEKMIRKSYRKL